GRSSRSARSSKTSSSASGPARPPPERNGGAARRRPQRPLAPESGSGGILESPGFRRHPERERRVGAGETRDSVSPPEPSRDEPAHRPTSPRVSRGNPR